MRSTAESFTSIISILTVLATATTAAALPGRSPEPDSEPGPVDSTPPSPNTTPATPALAVEKPSPPPQGSYKRTLMKADAIAAATLGVEMVLAVVCGTAAAYGGADGACLLAALGLGAGAILYSFDGMVLHIEHDQPLDALAKHPAKEQRGLTMTPLVTPTQGGASFGLAGSF